MPRRTKIVATLGPASESRDVLSAMIAAGLDVARLNLSHGEPEVHLKRLAAVRAAAAEAGRVVGVLADLPGPKVRSGPFPATGTFLREGTHVKLFVGVGPCDDTHIAVDYASLLSDLRVGDRVILGDGTITLVVTQLDEHEAEAVVISGGLVQGRPGIHIPSERLRLTAPTDRDLELLAVVAPLVDFVGVSFVRTASDLRGVRSAIASGGPMIIAKIETTAAVLHLAEILEVADGVMVARAIWASRLHSRTFPTFRR